VIRGGDEAKSGTRDWDARIKRGTGWKRWVGKKKTHLKMNSQKLVAKNETWTLKRRYEQVTSKIFSLISERQKENLLRREVDSAARLD